MSRNPDTEAACQEVTAAGRLPPVAALLCTSLIGSRHADGDHSGGRSAGFSFEHGVGCAALGYCS